MAVVIICAVIAVLVILWLFMGFFFYNMTLPRRISEPFRLETLAEPKDDTARAYVDWAKTANPERVYITAQDGTKLAGIAFTQSRPENRWVIAAHGYSLGKEFMYYAAQKFYGWGMNVLTIDLRGHGESGGGSIGMGWLDRADFAQWIKWIESRENGAKIALYGISMGAAAVTIASAENLPPSVKAVIADCGYTSAAAVFAYQAKKLYHLPAWFVMPPFALMARIFAGYGVYAASPLKQLQKGGELPILLAHGEADDFVPFHMLKPLSEAAGGRAEVITVKGAGHGECCVKEPERYWAAVRGFTEKHLHSEADDGR